MNWLAARIQVNRRHGLALLAGGALAAAFPSPGIAGLAWVAPAAIVATALGQGGGRSFRLGYLAGLAHYLVSLHWLLNIPYRWHGVPLAPGFGWIALSAFLALGMGGWVWLVCRLAGGQGVPPSPEGVGVTPTLGDHFATLLAPTWRARMRWTLIGAAAWVAGEMLLARLFGGFPWNLLGTSQYQMAPLIQVASATGVYGVSFLVVWFSLGLLCAAANVTRQPAGRSVWMAELFPSLLAVALVFNSGFHALRHPPPATRHLRATLVQPAVPQTLIWDASKDAERLQQMLDLGRQASSNQADLLVWPEGSIPGFLRYDEKAATGVSSLARDGQAWVIAGGDDFEHRPGAPRPQDGYYYNGCFLINPRGELAGPAYHKRNLVMFGEYLPCVRWLPFLKWFTPIEGGFTPGGGPGAFALAGLGVTASPLICFEDAFPQLDVGGEDQAVDLLVNVTNDGWFGEGAEQWQHAAAAVFRAVERGVPLIRCANNGITCWVDAQGRVREIFRDAAGSPYGRGFMTVEIPLPPAGERAPPTFYSRRGDWFGWSCAGLTLVLLGGLAVNGWRARRSEAR